MWFAVLHGRSLDGLEPNALLQAHRIDAHCRPDDAAAHFLRAASDRLGWSGRGLHRCLKVARTIADLAGSGSVPGVHVTETLPLPRGLAS